VKREPNRSQKTEQTVGMEFGDGKKMGGTLDQQRRNPPLKKNNQAQRKKKDDSAKVKTSNLQTERYHKNKGKNNNSHNPDEKRIFRRPREKTNEGKAPEKIKSGGKRPKEKSKENRT